MKYYCKVCSGFCVVVDLWSVAIEACCLNLLPDRGGCGNLYSILPRGLQWLFHACIRAVSVDVVVALHGFNLYRRSTVWQCKIRLPFSAVKYTLHMFSPYLVSNVVTKAKTVFSCKSTDTKHGNLPNESSGAIKVAIPGTHIATRAGESCRVSSPEKGMLSRVDAR